MTWIKICDSCGSLVTELSAWCDCTKAETKTEKWRPLTLDEWGYIQDEPPSDEQQRESGS